jgi:DMSO reductase family type II enzyme heme b subunit
MRMRSISWLVLAATAVGCGGQAPPAAVTEVVAVRRPALPDDPGAAAWADVPAYHAILLPQDVVEPRLLAPSTPAVEVQAITDGARVAFRLTWPDATKDDLPDTGRFSDACAVQLPATTEADVPAPQMGEAGRPVEITYWRATWQAMADGRPDTVAAIHPGASVDHYPFEAASLKRGSPEQEAMAERYAPARALENDMAGPRTSPVEDLVAGGPGTLHPAAEGRSAGRGRRTADGWAVVLSRPMPERLAPQERTQVAFAVWDGAHQEVGARKMRTGWVPMLVEGTP